AEVLALAGPDTRRVDLKGAFVIPGLVDAHGHVASLGERLSSVDVRGMTSVEAITNAVRAHAARGLPEGAWITGGGWDQNLWQGEQFPTHAPLDAASPDRPVLLRRVDGHASWASLEAMQAAGITRDTKDPDG